MRRGILVGLLATTLVGLSGCTTYSRLAVDSSAAHRTGSSEEVHLSMPWFYVTADRRALLLPVQEYTSDHTDPCWYGYVVGSVSETSSEIVVYTGAYQPSRSADTMCPTETVPGSWFLRVPLSAPYRRQKVMDAVTGDTRTFRGMKQPSAAQLANYHARQ